MTHPEEYAFIRLLGKRIDTLLVELEQLKAQVAELRKALEPFAKRPRDFCIRDLKNAEAALANPAPGADLLAELELLRSRVAELEK